MMSYFYIDKIEVSFSCWKKWKKLVDEILLKFSVKSFILYNFFKHGVQFFMQGAFTTKGKLSRLCLLFVLSYPYTNKAKH
jgi:hypothetical protein